MFDAILTYDLCIAVLTGANPNVYYELAIAQAAARPVVVMLEKGQLLPFDIKDLRCVAYDLKPRTMHERVYVKEIVDHIRALEATGWRGRVPFGDLSPLGGRSRDEAIDIVERATHFRTPENAIAMFEGCTERIELMGVTLGFYRRIDGIFDLLRARADAGCVVRALLMHPENPSFREFNNESIRSESFAHTVQAADEMFRNLARLGDQSGNVAVRRMRRGFQSGRLARTDREAIFMPYLFAQKAYKTPLVRCLRGSEVYEWLGEEFEALWGLNDLDGLGAAS
jgi:hypothetical protein